MANHNWQLLLINYDAIKPFDIEVRVLAIVCFFHCSEAQKSFTSLALQLGQLRPSTSFILQISGKWKILMIRRTTESIKTCSYGFLGQTFPCEFRHRTGGCWSACSCRCGRCPSGWLWMAAVWRAASSLSYWYRRAFCASCRTLARDWNNNINKTSLRLSTAGDINK